MGDLNLLIKDIPGDWKILQDNTIIAYGEPPLSSSLEVGLYCIESMGESIMLEVLNESSLRYIEMPVITRSERGGWLMISSPPASKNRDYR